MSGRRIHKRHKLHDLMILNCRKTAQPALKNTRTYRTKSTSGGHILRVSDQIKQLNLLQRGLTSGQPPRLRQDLDIKHLIHLIHWSKQTHAVFSAQVTSFFPSLDAFFLY